MYGKLVLGRATLTWDDTMNRWGGESAVVSQVDAPPPSCVWELGRPTIDWSNANDLIPNEYYADRRGAGDGD